MEVLRVQATNAVRALAQAFPGMDEGESRNLERCCDLLMTDEELLQRNGPCAEAYGICRELRRHVARGAAQANANYNAIMQYWGPVPKVTSGLSGGTLVELSPVKRSSWKVVRMISVAFFGRNCWSG